MTLPQAHGLPSPLYLLDVKLMAYHSRQTKAAHKFKPGQPQERKHFNATFCLYSIYIYFIAESIPW